MYVLSYIFSVTLIHTIYRYSYTTSSNVIRRRIFSTYTSSTYTSISITPKASTIQHSVTDN